ncbi:MAG: DHH family phosphoesterase [Cellulosilyticum sp.]|nr:DHH family phosphoesterase [Cellulosilyticum sp.]MEE1073445.1 DHH family phosphoesterase [Cellulosilyticum sp.]
MKIKTDKRFSYTIIILRICQLLLIIGIIIQCIRIINFPQAGVGLGIYFIVLLVSLLGEKKITQFIRQEVEEEVEYITSIKDSMFTDIQLPVVIVEEVGNIKWCNKAFQGILKEKHIIGKNIKSIFPDMKIGEWMLEEQLSQKKINIGSKFYEVMLEAFIRQDGIKQYAFYFVDCTEKEKLSLQIQDEKTMIGYLCIDNIDEISHSIEEVRRPMLLAIIDRKINLWFKEREVVIARMERDKYMIILSRKELKKMEETKFDILDEVRRTQVGNELPVTISIGIGNNAVGITNSKDDARIAFDLAQGRGGDQAIIKHHDKYTFYGGKTKEVEKSTRVKARIKAYAFKELLHEADKIIIMGHQNIDMDCLGAAMGVYRGAALFGKKAQIVLRQPTFAIQGLYDRIIASKEYDDLFITPDEAEREMNKDTLLVIVDTHRKSYLEAPELLEISEKIVIFDHHRKSTDYIEDAVLTYIEPFISSTCEMISEILNYLSDKAKLNPIEADALLAGITIDTKNFVSKAGVRTFEAAAFLRRSGADSTRVRMLFQDDMETYRSRARAIQMAEVWHENMAVSVVNSESEHITIIAAQVADELLNIKGIKASFVFSQIDDWIYISARALGETNVQRIMELLGGGGHLGIAGAQLKDVTIDMAKQKLKEAIALYFEEGESK